MIAWGDNMNICIIGLGSMGKRRIRLLQQINPSFQLMGVDISEDRRQEVEATFHIPTQASLEAILPVVDACLVCTAPITHASIIKQCVSAGKHVFTELNLVADGYDELIELAASNHVHIFQSSTMLFRKEIAYITDRCQKESNLTYSYHVGQYLSDWHPWESYENFFVSNQRTNGCRELFAIELPWLLEAFGPVTAIQVVQAKKSDLKISYPDTYQVLLTHENGNTGMLWIDVVCRVACRQFKVSSETLHLTWSGTPTSLTDYQAKPNGPWIEEAISLYEDVTQDSRYSSNIIENMYVDELINFLNVLTIEEEPRYSLSKDAIVLGLIDQIEANSKGDAK